MPAPESTRPSAVKNLIPSVSGSFCDRFLRTVTGFAQTFFDKIDYEVDEATGLPTNDFKADLCLTGCVGGGTGGETPNPNMPAPTHLMASDDSFADKIRITWDAVIAPTGVSPVTQYKIYRSTSINANTAALVATVAAPTVTYDDIVDGDLIAGTNYTYWVRATNGLDTSVFSSPDGGRAATSGEVGSLTAISDLKTTIGFGYSFIALVWTPPASATKYDIWRNTVNDFGTATKIYADRSPYSTTHLLHDTMNPTFWDNVGEVVLYDTPPSASQDYYYFVVAKADSPPAQSDESNGSLGRVDTPAIYNGIALTLDYASDTYVVGSYTKMWAVLKGGGAGGGGGNDVYGGGGGGGPASIREEFIVAPGDVITIVTTGTTPDTGNAAASTTGSDGTIVELQINGGTVLTANGGHGGVFNPAGNGAGGAGDTAVGTSTPIIYDGRVGSAAAGSAGGRSGYYFSGRRLPSANYYGSYNGNGTVGSGASATPTNALLATGGSGLAGSAYIAFGT